jgi:hypothetical protein
LKQLENKKKLLLDKYFPKEDIEDEDVITKKSILGQE